jgi:hypothetical protein
MNKNTDTHIAKPLDALDRPIWIGDRVVVDFEGSPAHGKTGMITACGIDRKEGQGWIVIVYIDNKTVPSKLYPYQLIRLEPTS